MKEYRTLMARCVGEYIVSLRKDKHIRQEDLAARAGVSLRSLRMIEKGEVSASLYTLVLLSEALGERFEDLWENVRKNLALQRKNEGVRG